MDRRWCRRRRRPGRGRCRCGGRLRRRRRRHADHGRGEALDKASEAALEATGGGRVTDTETGDEDGAYEVEVTLDDGREVDVDLDEQFHVISTDVDGPDDDADDIDDADD